MPKPPAVRETTAPEPRKGMPSVELNETEFLQRFLSQFSDPAFDAIADELEKVAAVAWDGFSNSPKSPPSRPAGQDYVDPSYDLPDDWRDAKRAIDRAEREYEGNRLFLRDRRRLE